MSHAMHEANTSDGSPSELPPYLRELDPTQWTRSTTPVMDTLLRRWSDGSLDTLIVLNPDVAHVRRDDGRGRKVKDDNGTAVEMARFIQHLPAPGTPGAPSGEVPDPAIEPMK
jgi:hypothetical protein